MPATKEELEKQLFWTRMNMGVYIVTTLIVLVFAMWFFTTIAAHSATDEVLPGPDVLRVAICSLWVGGMLVLAPGLAWTKFNSARRAQGDLERLKDGAKAEASA